MLSTVFGCLWCASGCSAQRVGAHFAFFPPNPPTYTVSTDAQGNPKLRLGLQRKSTVANVETGVELIVNSLKEEIAVFYFRVSKPKAVIIFSHGNAMDCGIIFYYWMEMAHRLDVDVYAYDYTGYGASTGKPSETATYADITAVYEYIKQRGVNPKDQIILYGQSVGTGPSCYLASTQPVRGLVLHSPMLTGIRVIANNDSFCSPACLFRSCDLFPNIRRIPQITAPVFIMHGTDDVVIDISHAHGLLTNWPKKYIHEPYIVEGAGHDDIYEKDPTEYYNRMQEFIKMSKPEKGSAALPPMSITML